MIYISHPYTGNEEENINDAENIAVQLAKKYPQTFFINPIAVMKHEAIAKNDYMTIIDKCLELLGLCDAVIFCGNWQQSKGCMCEYGFAKANKMVIYKSVDDFDIF